MRLRLVLVFSLAVLATACESDTTTATTLPAVEPTTTESLRPSTTPVATSPPAPSTTVLSQNPMDLDRLVEALVDAGASVSEIGEFDPRVLGGVGHGLCVNGERVSVYSYAGEEERRSASDGIDRLDPSKVTRTDRDGDEVFAVVEWTGNPTFWARDRIIVLYAGSMLGELITSVMGPPFASGTGRDSLGSLDCVSTEGLTSGQALGGPFAFPPSEGEFHTVMARSPEGAWPIDSWRPWPTDIESDEQRPLVALRGRSSQALAALYEYGPVPTSFLSRTDTGGREFHFETASLVLPGTGAVTVWWQTFDPAWGTTTFDDTIEPVPEVTVEGFEMSEWSTGLVHQYFVQRDDQIASILLTPLQDQQDIGLPAPEIVKLAAAVLRGLTDASPTFDGLIDCGTDPESWGIIVDFIATAIGAIDPATALTDYLARHRTHYGGDIVITGSETGSLVVNGREVVVAHTVMLGGGGFGVGSIMGCTGYENR